MADETTPAKRFGYIAGQIIASGPDRPPAVVRHRGGALVVVETVRPLDRLDALMGYMTPADLRAALDLVPPGAWSEPSDYRQNKLHHRYSRCPIYVPDGFNRSFDFAKAFDPVLAEYAPVHEAYLSRIEPGGFVIPHTDASRWYERWHVPIVPAGTTLMDHGHLNYLGPVNTDRQSRLEHWRPHSVWNDTDRTRIHLIIDRDVVIDRTPAPFQTYPIPERYRALVDAA